MQELQRVACNNCTCNHGISDSVSAITSLSVAVISSGVARIWSDGWAKNYMELFVTRKMTRKNTLNKVHM